MATRTNVNKAAQPAKLENGNTASDLVELRDGKAAVQVAPEQAVKAEASTDKDLKKKKEEEEAEELARAGRAVDEAESAEEVAESSEESSSEELASSEELSSEEQAAADQIQEYAAELDASAQTQLVAAQDFGNWFAQAATGAASGGAAAAGTVAGISTTAIIAGVAVVGVAAAAGSSSSSGTTLPSGGTVTDPTDSTITPPTVSIPVVSGNFSLSSISTSALQGDVVPTAPAPTMISATSFTAANTVDLSATAGSLAATAGTDGSDLFVATKASQLAGAELLGVGGTDKLSLTIAGAELTESGDGILDSTSIEILSLTNTSTADNLEFYVGNMDGLAEVRNDGSDGDVIVTGIASADVKLVASDVSESVVTFTYGAAAIAAATTDAAATVILEGVSGNAEVVLDTNTAAGGLAEVVISSNGTDANVLKALTETATTDTVKTLTIVGETDLTITNELDDTLTALATIDASELGGNLVVDLGAMTAAYAIEAGSGDANSVTATVAVDVAPTIVRVQDLDLTFSASKTFDAEDVLGLESVTLAGAAGIAPSFINMDTGVSFNTSAMTATTASTFNYRNASDFDLNVSSASTAAAISFGGLTLENVRNADISTSNKSTTATGDISFDDAVASNSLTLSNSGSAAGYALTVGDVTADGTGDFILATTTAAKGTITIGNVDVTGDLSASLTASTATLTVDNLESSGEVVAVLAASGAALTVDDVDGSKGVNIMATATSDTASSGSGEDISIGEVSATSGNIALDLNVTASGSVGDGGSITVGNIDGSAGSFGLDVATGGGDKSTNVTVGDVAVTADIAVTVAAAAGSAVTVGTLDSSDGGAIGIDIDNQSTSSRASSTKVAATAATTFEDISTDGDISLEVTNGASGDVFVGNLITGEGSVVVSVVSNGKAADVSVGNIEATGLDGTASITALANAGNVDVHSVTADSDITIQAEGLAGSDFFITNQIDSASGAVSVTASAASSSTSKSNIDISGGSTIDADASISLDLSVGTGGNVDVGDSTSATGGITTSITGGDSASIVTVGTLTAEQSVDIDLSLGTASAATFDDVSTTAGNVSVTVAAASKATAAGNTEANFGNIDADAGAVTFTVSDVGTDGLVLIDGSITSTDSISVTASLQKDAELSVAGDLTSDGAVSVDLTLGTSAEAGFANLTSSLDAITVGVSTSADTVSGIKANFEDLSAAEDVGVTIVGGSSTVVNIGDVDSSLGETSLNLTGGSGSVINVAVSAGDDKITALGDVSVTASVGNSSSSVTSTLAVGNLESATGSVDINAGSGTNSSFAIGDVTASVDVDLTLSIGGNSEGLTVGDLTATTGSITGDIVLTYASTGGSDLTIGEITATAGSVTFDDLDIQRSNTLAFGNVDALDDISITGLLGNAGNLDVVDLTTTAGDITLEATGGATGVRLSGGDLSAFGDLAVEIAGGSTSSLVMGNLETDSGTVDLTVQVGATSSVSVLNTTSYDDLTVSLSIGGNSDGVSVGTLTSTTGDVVLSKVDLTYSSAGVADANLDAISATDGDVKFSSISVGNTNVLVISDVDAGGTDGDVTVTKASVGTGAAELVFGDLSATDDIVVTSLSVGSESSASFGNIDAAGSVTIAASLGTSSELTLGSTLGVIGEGVSITITQSGQGGNIDISGNIDAGSGLAKLEVSTTSTESAGITIPNITGGKVDLDWEGQNTELTTVLTAGNTEAVSVISATITGNGNSDITVVSDAGTKTTIDASASTGILTATTGEGDDTVKGGSGNDLISFGGNGDDTFDLGKGVDTVDFEAYAFTGNLELDFSSGDTGITAATADVLANFDEAETFKIVFDTGITGLVAGNVDLAYGNVDSFDTFLTQADANLDGSGTLVWGAHVGNLDDTFYVVIDHDKSGTVNSGDSVIAFEDWTLGTSGDFATAHTGGVVSFIA